MTNQAIIDAVARAMYHRFWRGDIPVAIEEAQFSFTEFAKAAISAYEKARWQKIEEFPEKLDGKFYIILHKEGYVVVVKRLQSAFLSSDLGYIDLINDIKNYTHYCEIGALPDLKDKK